MNQDKTQAKTQILPKITQDRQDETQTVSQIRISPATPDYTEPGTRSKNSPAKRVPQKAKRKNSTKIIVLICCFLAACLLGFYLMTDAETTNQSNYNAKLHKVEVLNQKVNDLSQEETQLEQKRQELTQLQSSLETQKQQLNADKNVLQELFDEITGKAAEDKIKVRQLSEKIDRTKANLKELNQDIAEIKAMRDKARTMKAEAVNDLNQFESEWEGFLYKIRLLIGNLTK